MITISPLDHSHQNLVLNWRNSPQVSKWFCHNEIIDVSTHSTWFSQILEKNRKEGWIIKVDKTPCGVIMFQDINVKNKRLSSGYFIGDPKFFNRGLGVVMAIATIDLAFKNEYINKVSGEILACNINAIKVADLIGWTKEGFLTNHLLRNDGYHNIILNAYFRENWENPSIRVGNLIKRIKLMYKVLE